MTELSVADTSKTDSARVTILCNPPDPMVVDMSGLFHDITVHGLGGFGSPSAVTTTPGEHQTISVSGPVSPTAYDTGIALVNCRLTTTGPDQHRYEALAAAQVVGAARTFTGHFTTCAGAPLAGIRVTARSLPPNISGVVQSTVTDAKGAFAFPTLPAGLYQVNFVPPPGYIDTRYSELPPGSFPTENIRDTLITGSGTPAAGTTTMEDPVRLSTDPRVICS